MKVIVIQNRMGIGDLIIFLPYIFSISQEYNMPVSLLVRKNARAKELLKNNPHVSEIITLDRDDKNRTGRHQGVVGILNLIQDLRKRNLSKPFILECFIKLIVSNKELLPVPIIKLDLYLLSLKVLINFIFSFVDIN